MDFMELSLSSAKSFFVRKTVLQSLQGHFSFEKPFCKACKVIFHSKNPFAKPARSFFIRKTLLQSLQGHFSFEKPFCKACKVIFRSKKRFPKFLFVKGNQICPL